MSSIVNKSSTRFAPKVKQRRAIGSSITPVLQDISPGSIPASSSEKKEAVNMQTTPIICDTILSQSDLKQDLNSSQIGTQIAFDVHKQPENHQTIARLDSLSNNKGGYKVNVFDTGVTNVNKSEAQNRENILKSSDNTLKKRIISHKLETNTSLQTTKRYKSSEFSSVSKKPGSGQKISIIPQMHISESQDFTSTQGTTNLKVELSGGIFQRTDDLYEKYKISNIKEIPKNITDEDSSRYLLDENNFTMADLCKPYFPIGEISENFQRAKDAIKSKLETRKKRRELRQMARDQFRPVKELTLEEQERLISERRKAAEDILNADVPEEKPVQGIQLRLNADGTLVVDEESTIVNRHKNASFDNAHKERLDNNPFENLHNTHTYGRQQYTDPWSNDEMVKFYQALSMWGTDFNLISQLFPYRTRRQVKAKFVNEEKKHPVMIELALRSKLPPNFTQYCKDIKKDIGTIEDFNKKLEELQVEHEEHLKQIEISKQNAKEQDLHSQSTKELDHMNNRRSLRSQRLQAHHKSEIILGTIDDMKRHITNEIEARVEN